MIKRWAAIPLLIAAMSHAADKTPPIRDARVTVASGQVTLKNTINSKKTVMLHKETPLMEQDVLETGPESWIEITLDGETVFILRENARLKITKLFLRNTRFELSQGVLLAKVKSATAPDAGIILKLPTAVVAVTGTEFIAEAQWGLSHVGVFGGQVLVSGSWGYERVLLGPLQETRVPLSNVPQQPRRLSRFRIYRQHLQRLRQRAVIVNTQWRPLSLVKKQAIRRKLFNPPHSHDTNGRRI